MKKTNTILAAFMTLSACTGAWAADSYWWGKVSSDATNLNNWAWNAYYTNGGVYFKASDVADSRYGNNGSYTVDFKDNVVTGYWMTVSCANAFSYNPIVWTGTTGGLYLTEKFYVGGGNEGALDIQGGNHYAADNLLVGQAANTGKGWLNIGVDATLTTPKILYMAADASNEGAVTNAGHLAVGGLLSLAKDSSTKAELVNTGTLTIGGNTELGYGNGSAAGITNKGSIAAHWFCLSGVNGKARFVQDSGLLTVADWMCIGSIASISTTYDAFFQVNGGAVTNSANNITIGSTGSSAAKAVLEVNGGEVYTKGEIYVNERGYTDCELRVNGGKVHANGVIYANLKEKSQNGKIIVTGGELTSGGNMVLNNSGNGTAQMLVTGGYVEAVNKDILVADNGNAELTVSGGVVRCGYWIPTARDAKSDAVIRVYDGELSAGYRNGSVQSTDGVFDLCCKAGSSALYEQFGGVANFTYNGDAVRMSVASGTKSELRILGGTMNVTGKINLGYASQTTNTLTIATNALVRMGGISTVNATDDDTANNTLYLDGGVLQANATASIGGKFNIYVKAGGAIIDTTNCCVTVANGLQSGVAAGETDGGLLKKGRGILTLTGATTYNGVTDVQEGVLAVNAGHSFTGGVKIGAKGAIAVAINNATLTKDQEITLFTTSGISFEDDADSIATSVFLTGNVIGYTLSSTNENGVTTVKAQVTDITNITSTRKVTTFIGGPAEDDDTSAQHFVDQSSAWSNGYPDDGQYDVAIFPGDAHMCIWSSDKSEYHNKAAGDFVIRGGRVTVVRSNAARWPIIGARHIAGSGTLCLQGVGLQSANTLVVDAGVTVDVGYPKLPSVAKDQDCWTDTSAETAPLTIDGSVVATNGFIHFRGYTTINGPITVGPYASGTSGIDRDNAHVVFNGTVTVLDGATFAFGDHSSSVTFGENAKLVLKGTGKISGVSGIVFPTIVLGEGSAHLFSELNNNGGNLELDGGTLKMAYNQLDGTGTNLVLKAGQLTLDMSGVSSVSEGTTATIPGVTLAQGVSLTDVTIVGSNSSFAWTASLEDDGTIKLTAKTPEGPNRWVGGASGNWKDAVNWQYGVPANDATAQIDNEAIIYFDANKTVSNIVVNANVQFRVSSNNPTIYIREVNGTGTIGLYHCGFEANGLPGTIASTVTLRFDSTESSGSDSWLKGSSASNPLLVYAPLTGSGYARVYDNTRFYGNNEGFKGKMRKDDIDARFMTPQSGLPNAEKFDCHGTLWIWFDEGTITFPATTMTSTGNRGINMPAGAATSEKGVTLVVGNNDGNVTMSGSYAYRAYTQSGTWWTDGCTNFTFKKIGTGTLSTYIESACNLSLEGGVTSFAADCWGAAITVKSNACLTATASVRKIGGTNGSLTMESGSGIWLDNLDNATNLVADCDVGVTGVTIVVDEDVQEELRTKTDPKVIPVLIPTDGHTITGTPATVKIPTSEAKVWWVAKVKDNALNLVRKSIKKGLRIVFH